MPSLGDVMFDRQLELEELIDTLRRELDTKYYFLNQAQEEYDAVMDDLNYAEAELAEIAAS